MRIYFLVLMILGILGCNHKFYSKTYHPSFINLISNDSLLQIELKEETTAFDIKQDVCNKGCKDLMGYTGDYTLKYSLLNRSFLKFNNDSFIVSLPFLGFKCHDSNLDFFYSVMKIEYMENDILKIGDNYNVAMDSIGFFIKNHIVKTHSENNYPPVIEVSINHNMPIKNINKVIGHILDGYYELINEYALMMYGKELDKVDSLPNLNKLKNIEPLRLRLLIIGDTLYCPG